MADLLPLRDYQREAIDAVYADWSDGFQRVAMVLATGAGKTVVFSHLIAESRTLHRMGLSKRSVVLVHRDELVFQAVDKLTQVAPELSVGVVKAERNEVDAEVVVASVQTLSRRSRVDQLRDVGLVVCDEVHHAAAKSYRAVMDRLGCYDPNTGVRFLGVTATLARGDNKRLADVIEKVSYSRDILELVRDGYLVPPKGRRVTVDGMDLTDVRVTRGDFSDSELASELDDAGAAQVVAKAYLDHAPDRAGLLFAPTVASAHVFAEELRRAGVAAEVAWGDMPLADRRALLRRFNAGEIQVVCNAQIFTEGTDLPFVSCVVVARPTYSAPLYTQMAGRALRPYPGKNDALIIDVVGVTGEHRLANIIDLSARTRDTGEDVELYYGEGGEEVDLLTAVGRLYSDKRKGASGKLTYDEIDLFSASKSVWLQTYKGVWFIPNAYSVFFLWPNRDGTYRVVQRTKGGAYARLKDKLTLSYAMSWAETFSNEEDADSPYSISGRQAAWRKRRAKPTDAQIEFAGRQGIDTGTAELMSKAELSDAISVAMASRAIDRFVKE